MLFFSFVPLRSIKLRLALAAEFVRRLEASELKWRLLKSFLNTLGPFMHKLIRVTRNCICKLPTAREMGEAGANVKISAGLPAN